MLPFFTQDHAALQAQARLWAEKNLFAGHGSEDLERRARTLVKQLGAAGFLKHAVSKQFGGVREQVEARDLCILREELARGDALADTMFALQALGSYPITLAGNAAQKQNYLSQVASGDAIAAFAITEPEAGSDVASLQTTALRQGEQFALNGTKRFISNAGIADFYVVFASTEPEKKAKGVSAFIVDANTPGLAVTEKTQAAVAASDRRARIHRLHCAASRAARRRGRRLEDRLGNARSFTLQRRRGRRRFCPTGFGGSDSLQQDAPAIWPGHRRVPGD